MNTNTGSSRYELGIAVFKKLDPQTAELLMDYLKDLSPDLGRFAVEFGYGDVMSRPGLDLRTRELVNIGTLGAMGNCATQLENHIRGALNLGINKSEIVEVILQLAVFVGFPMAFNAMAALKRVLAQCHKEVNK